jgi:hypothetical protein
MRPRRSSALRASDRRRGVGARYPGGSLTPAALEPRLRPAVPGRGARIRQVVRPGGRSVHDAASDTRCDRASGGVGASRSVTRALGGTLQAGRRAGRLIKSRRAGCSQRSHLEVPLLLARATRRARDD